MFDEKKSTSLFKYFNKLSIFKLNNLQIAKFVYQALSVNAPICIKSFFKTSAAVHSHSTRQQNRLFSQFYKSNIRKFSIPVMGPAIWNSIPEEIQQAYSLPMFSIKYKRFLIDDM